MRLIFAKRLSARQALKFKLSLINVPFARSRDSFPIYSDVSVNEFGEFDAYNVCIGNMHRVLPIDTDV